MNTFTLRRSWFLHAGARVASALTIASLMLTLAGPVLFAFPGSALAATSIVNESFGTGSDLNDIPDWNEEGNDNDSSTLAKSPGSGDDSASPNGGRFAKIGEEEWICRQLDATGLTALKLKYYWRGDGDAENNSDTGVVEYRATSNGNTDQTCNSNKNSWTQLATHELDNDPNGGEVWSSLQTISLPAELDNDSSWFIRFRNEATCSFTGSDKKCDGDSSDDEPENEYFRVDGIQIEGDPIPGTLIVKKVLIKDNGGTHDKDDFSFSVNNAGAVQFESDGQNELSVAPGTYSVVETAAPGYTTTYDNCSNVQVASGQTVTCTITNNDKPAKLRVYKTVAGEGAPHDPDDFSFLVNNMGPHQIGANGYTDVTLNPGTYDITEYNPPVNYSVDESGCQDITLALGEEKSCTITNTFVPPPPPQCNANAPYSVVSDATNTASSTTSMYNGPAVPIGPHPAWASIPGAVWIWESNPVSDPTMDHTTIFTKTFTISNPVTSASIAFATDNGYILKINNVVVKDEIAVEHNYGTVDTVDVAAYLTVGTNKIEFTVKNFGINVAPEDNPAGVIYKLSYNVNECEEPLSCNPEVNLVKNPSFETPVVVNNGGTWELFANGAPLLEWMTSYLSGNTPSLLEIQRGYSGWLAADGLQFAELDSNEPTTVYQDIPTIPGKNYTFSYKFAARPDASTLADNTANVWWGGSLAGTPSSNSVSGGPNTDWKTFSHSVVATTSLTRIAFEDAGTANSLGNFVDQVSVTCQPEPPKASVTICKYDTNENELSGWTMLLKGDHVEDLSVPTGTSSGINTVNALTGGASYIAVASGTWNNQGGANPVDAEYSTTDGWATQMDGYTGYQTDILELQINSAFDPNSNWGPYSSTHEYAQSFVQGATGPANFRIFDGTGTTQNEGWFGDNSGTLSVSVHEGYAGVTGQNGCVTFTDVPYGTYTVGELMKPNWQNESGLIQVTVDESSETYMVVNKDMTPPPPATVVAQKVVCSAEKYLPNWGAGGPDITATTAADYVAAINDEYDSEVCSLQDWTFEWAPSVATNPGDNNLSGGTGWTAFSGSTSIPSGSLIWLREQLPTGYVPFTGANTTQDVSAEFYCHTDVLHYDNYDWIDPVAPGGTYYCVGFNAPVAVVDEDEEGGTLIIEKLTEGGDGTFTFFVSDSSQESPEVGEYSTTTVQGFATITIEGLYGTYDVWEDVPEGWTLESISCDYEYGGEGEVEGNGVEVSIDDGETVTCTFVNVENEGDDGNDDEGDGGGSGPTPFSAPTPPGGGVTGIGGGGGSVLGAATGGQVLGASCSVKYLDKFLRMGKPNDAEQVKKLQEFLNKHGFGPLPVTGFFGPMTHAAVIKFQAQYLDEVLKPWGLQAPTGIVYLTTQRWINIMECPELNLTLPPLTPWAD